MKEYKDNNNKEWLIYILNIDNPILETKSHVEINDEDFIRLAEEDGSVYSLQGFQEAFNLEFINNQDFIRILYV